MFGSASRENYNSMRNNPGPGSYNLRTIKTDGPLFKFFLMNYYL